MHVTHMGLRRYMAYNKYHEEGRSGVHGSPDTKTSTGKFPLSVDNGTRLTMVFRS